MEAEVEAEAEIEMEAEAKEKSHCFLRFLRQVCRDRWCNYLRRKRKGEMHNSFCAKRPEKIAQRLATKC